MFNNINKNIIETLGISSLPVDQQAEAMEKLGGIVYQEVMIRAIDAMAEEDKDAFEKLIEENPDPEALFTFLHEKVPGIDQMIDEEAKKLRDESADIMGQIGK